ncbi:ATP-binding protein [Desulfovulcanus sp.]
MEIFFKTTAKPCTVRLLVRAAIAVLEELVEGDLVYDLRLALTEACNNVVLHAYGGEEGALELKMVIVPGVHVQFEVVDWGSSFVPPSVLSDSSFILPERHATSGRGLFIIKKVADMVVFGRKDGKNFLIMRKNIGEGKWKVCK